MCIKVKYFLGEMRGIIHEFLSFTLIKSSSDFISLSETQKLTMIKMNQLMRYFIAFNKVELLLRTQYIWAHFSSQDAQYLSANVSIRKLL